MSIIISEPYLNPSNDAPIIFPVQVSSHSVVTLCGTNLANGIYFVMLTVKSQGQTSSSSVKVLILR